MNVPKPPFHSTGEELLYNIYLKIMGGEIPVGLTVNGINTLAKLNAILTDADLLSSIEIVNSINALKGNVPQAGDTLEKLYNIIAGINYLSQEDIDTIAELNAIINDADVVRTADLDAVIDNVPAEGDTLKKLYNLIQLVMGNLNTDASPPSLYCDFDVLFSNISLGSFSAGGGIGGAPTYSTFGVDNIENAFGVIKLSTGASTAGGSFLSTVYANIVLGIGYKIIISGRFALDSLSDNANSFFVFYGLGGPTINSLNPTNGVYFRHNHLLNGGRWEAVSRQGGIETAQDTGVAADINTYHIFAFEINPEGTSIDFFIDDLETPKATIVDNIPNGLLQSLMLFGKIEKTVGAASRSFYSDYVKYIPTRGVPR